MRHVPVLLLAITAGASATPASSSDAAQTPASAGSASQTPASAGSAFLAALAPLCGKAFAGALESRDAADAELAGKPMVMHVAHCAPGEIRIPFVVGEDRSRTWMLTATAGGVRLKHRHRHADGSPDRLTNYGGEHVGAAIGGADGTILLRFPADAESRAMFVAGGNPQSVANIWEMSIRPGATFTYRLTRPNRDFRVVFDLSKEVAAPPPPWGEPDQRQ